MVLQAILASNNLYLVVVIPSFQFAKPCWEVDILLLPIGVYSIGNVEGFDAFQLLAVDA